MLKEILVMFCIPFIVTGTEEGACECAAFLSKDSVEETPLTVHSTRFKASCDATGSLTCKNLCLFLTLQAGNTTSTVLCQSLKSDPIRATLESVKPSLFSRSCVKNPWEYTGMTSPTPVCCHEGRVVECVNA
ncbi:uncharacterized protein LOC126176696 [Schistocerca cancellata]|uniref:uncharacterized protein LOC126176696 n=1 Tax=Schistocerca cancellata TaxID=274614 RepID=UPI002119002E|nr:uncharacterized protein LOC126176696 [Schistocerca cancellata]